MTDTTTGHLDPAQRRPVLSDRQLCSAPPPIPAACASLNEGRSCRTGNSFSGVPLRCTYSARSTKAGPVGPATLYGPGRHQNPDGSLNEGRSCRTGNSGCCVRGHRHRTLRSTKAGPVGPATPEDLRGMPSIAEPAQRRPVLSDRQLWDYLSQEVVHPLPAQRRPVLSDRQLPTLLDKTTRVQSAQRRPVLSDRQLPGAGLPQGGKLSALNEGRSCRTGNSRCAGCALGTVACALNEGRSCRTGNSSTESMHFKTVTPAQRRPVLSDRQLGYWCRILISTIARSTKAGPVGPATLRRVSASPSDSINRSTKAGPVGPATPRRGCRRRARCGPLNEGRSCRTGNSIPRRRGPPPPPAAQRRPVLSDRQLWCSRRRRRCSFGAQRRPVLSDRQLRRCALLTVVRHAAQRRPVLSDRQLRIRSPRSPWLTIAQRRPVLSDRQLCGRDADRRALALPLNEGRSCRTGNSQGGHSRRQRNLPLNEGRSCRTGNSRYPLSSALCTQCPLNEGRSCRTGNSVVRPAHLLPQVNRSTKAGPVGPATPPPSQRPANVPGALNEGRSCRTGNSAEIRNKPVRDIIAQRRPVLSDRQLPPIGSPVGTVRFSRSTKAGPVGPATPARVGLHGNRSSPLNEGRSCRTGNSRRDRIPPRLG